MPAIKVNPLVSSANTREYLATKRTLSASSSFIAIDDDCSICLAGCTKDIPVLAYLADANDKYRNDFTSFIKRIGTNNTIVGSLIKVDHITGDEIVIQIVDDTYGRFFALGILQTNVWGFYLDWYKVANLLGFGIYKFNIKVSNSLAIVIFDEITPCYRLRPYNCDNAHKTVRIETQQNGYIVDGFDYRGINPPIFLPGGISAIEIGGGWRQQIRWYGKFIATTPTLITDYIVAANRDNEQVQTQLVANYTLDLYHIQTNLSNHFFRDNLLANKININDYNRNAQEVFVNVRVNPLEITERKTFYLNKNEIWSVSLEEFNKSTLKRN